MKGSFNRIDPHPCFPGNVNLQAHTKIRLKLDTLLLKFYVDIFDLGVAKIFAGAGAGVSRYNAKVTSSGTYDYLDDAINRSFRLPMYNFYKKPKSRHDLGFKVFRSTKITIDGIEIFV